MSRLFGDSGASSTSESITFTGLNYEMEVNKNGYECRSRESKWYNNRYFRISLLAIFEIIFYIRLGKPIYGDWYMPILFLATFVSVFIIYSCVFNDFKNLKMNHGAEHKVMNAFLNNDINNVNNYSRFSEGCGSNIYSILVILLFISPIIKFPVTIFLFYTIIYNNLEIVRRINFKILGKFVQKLTTAEPTEEILEYATEGFKRLIYTEVEKMVDEDLEHEKEKIS